MSKILGIHDKEAVEAMLAHIESECSKVDTDTAYDDMLDECFSFEKVGGIFSHMSPSRVLKECDPTAYRCGKNDWLDGERDSLIEINGGYYRRDDVDEGQQYFVDELTTELSKMEYALDDMEGDDEPDKNEIEKQKEEIERKRSAIEACENYAF